MGAVMIMGAVIIIMGAAHHDDLGLRAHRELHGVVHGNGLIEV